MFVNKKSSAKVFAWIGLFFEVFAAVPENIGRKVGTKVFVSALYASIFSSEVRPRLHSIFSEIIQCCKRIKNY